jgi:nitrogen fixation protein FixH
MTTIHAAYPTGGASTQAPRSRWWIWPAIIVAFLSAQIALSFTALYFALSDPSASVEPNYYAKGLSFDQQLAQERLLTTLGWQPSVILSGPAGSPPHRSLGLRLLDKSGAPIEGATVQVVAFAHVRAIDRHALTLNSTPASPGLYTVDLPTPQAGLWEFRFTFKQGSQTVTWMTQQVLTAEAQ